MQVGLTKSESFPEAQTVWNESDGTSYPFRRKNSFKP